MYFSDLEIWWLLGMTHKEFLALKALGPARREAGSGGGQELLRLMDDVSKNRNRPEGL